MAFNKLSYRDISSQTMAASRNVQELWNRYTWYFSYHASTALRGTPSYKNQIVEDNMKYSLIKFQQYTFTRNKLNATFNRTQR
jgi:hypothetical protein